MVCTSMVLRLPSAGHTVQVVTMLKLVSVSTSEPSPVTDLDQVIATAIGKPTSPTSSISWDRRVKNQPGPHSVLRDVVAEFACMGIKHAASGGVRLVSSLARPRRPTLQRERCLYRPVSGCRGTPGGCGMLDGRKCGTAVVEFLSIRQGAGSDGKALVLRLARLMLG
jgi:hypothetical protein